MIKTTICSIAIGHNYQENFLKLSDNILAHNPNNIKFICVTDNTNTISNSIQNICIKNSDHQLFVMHGHRPEFNFNLKYLPIEYAYKEDTECIIFIDSDWCLHEKFNILKLQKFIENFMNSEFDFIFERPHRIGGCKQNDNLFWRHKIDLYNLKNTNIYDNANVVNEQFLAFKKNEKMRIFIDSWKKRNTICLENNVRPWAEGVEIGMSYIDANMNVTNRYHNIMSECFYFFSKSGKKHIRW